METGINNLKDLVEIFAWLVGSGSLAFAAYSYFVSRKQLNFAVIVGCTDRFQKIMPGIKSNNGNINMEAIRQYVDLCNEELFYFKHGYLPDEIIDEWLDGMIYYLPHFKDSKNVNKDDYCIKALAKDNLLHDYPRIMAAFQVDREFNLSSREERKALIRIIKANLRKTNNRN